MSLDGVEQDRVASGMLEAELVGTQEFRGLKVAVQGLLHVFLG
jgi:hypothetical protein